MRRMLNIAIISCTLLFPCISQAKSSAGFKLELVAPPSTEQASNIMYDLAKTNEETLSALAENWSQSFPLPYDISIRFSNTTENPAYYPDQHTMLIGYPFMIELANLYAHGYSDVKEGILGEFVWHSTKFALYRELEQALINVFNFKIEQDPTMDADNFAAVFALEYVSDGLTTVSDAIMWFDLASSSQQKSSATTLDGHAIDAAHYYNLACLLDGKSPETALALAKKINDRELVRFLNEKGDQCQSEYRNQLSFWKKTLGWE